MTLGFVLPAVTAAFSLSTTQAGLLGTVGLVTSAVGGAMAGALADAVGRVRVLILSIGSYALFGLLAGCAQSYEQLLVFLTLQGLGFGGEWAAGAVLVAEYAQAKQRGRVIGAVQSAWSIGYALRTRRSCRHNTEATHGPSNCLFVLPGDRGDLEQQYFSRLMQGQWQVPHAWAEARCHPHDHV
jgi:sugar phosphate permease